MPVLNRHPFYVWFCFRTLLWRGFLVALVIKLKSKKGNEMKWREIVNEPAESILKRVCGGNDIVTEMTLPLKVFRERVEGLMFHLIENWCLCKYCQLYSPDNQDFGHWIGELRTYTDHLRNLEIRKGGGNKRSVLTDMFVGKYDYDEARKILVIIRDKFDVEKIMDMSKRQAVADAFASSIYGLIDFLCDTSISNATYLSITFGVEINQ